MSQHLTKLGVGDTEELGRLTDRDPVRVGVSQMGAPRVVLEGDAFHLARSDDVAPHESSSALEAAPEDPDRVESSWLHDYAPQKSNAMVASYSGDLGTLGPACSRRK